MRRQMYALGMVVAVMLGIVSSGWAADADSDEVDDAVDVCPGTVLPEEVPTQLLPQHYALTDADTTFNTFRGQESSFTTADTAGCSCEQIIALSGLGPLASQFGCNRQVMQTFIAAVQAVPPAPACSFCGDGVVDPFTEQCDQGGETAVCDVDCTVPACGDDRVNRAAGEQCELDSDCPDRFQCSGCRCVQ